MLPAILFIAMCLHVHGGEGASQVLVVPQGKASEIISSKNSYRPGKRWKTQKCELKNASGKDLVVYGHPPDFLFLQYKTKNPATGKWEPYQMGYCGTGAQKYTFPANGTMPLEVSLPAEIADRELKITFHASYSAADKKGAQIQSQSFRLADAP